VIEGGCSKLKTEQRLQRTQELKQKSLIEPIRKGCYDRMKTFHRQDAAIRDAFGMSDDE